MAAPDSIDELRHRFSAHPRRYFAPLANALRVSGALEEAVTILRAHLAEWPEHLTGHVVLGQALFDTGALVDARDAFEQARALDPGNRVVLRQLGEIASLAGDQATARMWFGRLRAADPYADDVDAQLGAGVSDPPYADERTTRDETTGIVPEREVVEAVAPETPAESEFELLEFDPVVTHAQVLDPVVGLDLAPSAHDLDDAAAHVLPADARDGSMGEDTPSVDQIASGPFATETMAGLLAAQGHTDQAIALYERLTAERPGDAALRARLDALRPRPDAAPSPADVVPAPPPPPSSSDDAVRGAMLAAAFASLAVREEPAAATPRSAAPTAAALDDEDPYADLSFDRFFVGEGAASGADRSDATPPPASASTAPDADADLARFDDWLREVVA